MKKFLSIVFIVTVFACMPQKVIAQETNSDVDTSEEFNSEDTFDEDTYDMDNIVNKGIRFGSEFPGKRAIRSKVLTEEEYIFKTYILDKLLKSNRVLY
ncbi:MAG: hypothetical protein B6226_05060 [Candidatus Cloacimonetes bacterium 4572_65]|nr:MAG: hypothetical protein B6226_05060 [Candidatus Cloacimonetes bacterium 4572_65]